MMHATYASCFTRTGRLWLLYKLWQIHRQLLKSRIAILLILTSSTIDTQRFKGLCWIPKWGNNAKLWNNVEQVSCLLSLSF